MAEPTTNQEKKDNLLNELKAKYTSLYKEVISFPGLENSDYSIDDLFIEPHLEYYHQATPVKLFGNPWHSLDSYRNCFNYPTGRPAPRRILEGPPGSGKSLIALKLANDWCRGGSDSPLNEIEIVIFLQLNRLVGTMPFFAATKQLLLPSECELSEKDIESILMGADSVAIIFDDYDMYIKQHGGDESEIKRIFEGEMFQGSDVTITATDTPKNVPGNVGRVRIVGQEDWSRDEYIRRVVGVDDNASSEIKRHLSQNGILADLMNNPVAFSIFVHMAQNDPELPTFRSCTSFFSYVLKRCHHTISNGTGLSSQLSKPCAHHETNHQGLDRLAFEALSEDNLRMIGWNKNEVLQRLGPSFYDHYVQAGILTEMDIVDYSQPSRFATFCHKFICEWYAASHIGRMAQLTGNEMDLRQSLSRIDPSEHQYVFRFACGQDPSTGDRILRYLKGVKDSEQLRILCALEQRGSVDDVKPEIVKLFSKEIQMWSLHSALLQRSTIELMEIAARNHISLSSLSLVDCLPRVDRSERKLRLGSGLSIPVLQTLYSLVINENLMISGGELAGILTFAARCSELKKLTFIGCKLPQSISMSPALSTLKSRNAEVLCDSEGVGVRLDFQFLNLDNGHWEVVGERRMRKERETGARTSEEPNNNSGQQTGEAEAGRRDDKSCSIM